MKRMLPWLLTLILLAGMALAVAWYRGSARAPVVSTDDAYVKADNVQVSSKVGGYVAEVSVQVHERVKPGQLLVRIDPADLALRVAQQRAVSDARQAALQALARQRTSQAHQIEQAVAALEMARAQAGQAAREEARDRQLELGGFVTAERMEHDHLAASIARWQVDRARADLAAGREQIAVLDARDAALQADLRQARAEASGSESDLHRAAVTAPLNAVVGSRTVEVGQYLRPGQVLLTLVPTGPHHVVANFKETEVARLRPGQAALVHLDALPDAVLQAVVDSIGPSTGSEFALLPAENATGNFTKIVQRVPVRLRFLGPATRTQAVRPGMSATVTIDTATVDGDRVGLQAAP